LPADKGVYIRDTWVKKSYIRWKDKNMKIKTFITRHPVASYFFLAYLISWGGSFALGGPKFLRGETLQIADALLIGLPMILGPSFAGIALTGIVDGRSGLRDLLSRMQLWRVGARWYATLLIFPLLILAVLLPFSTLVSQDFVPNILPIGILLGLVAGFFEEIGWTGFALPRMQLKRSTLAASIYLALLHGIWHLVAGYLSESVTYGAYWLPRFIMMWMVAMMAMRIINVWVYTNTKSLLLAQLIHASSTGFLFVFSPTPISPANETLWWAVYAIVLWVAAAVVVVRYGKHLRKEPQ
jgi:membrane protease YdiL (CAAX protease family)